MGRPRYRTHFQDPAHQGRRWALCGLMHEGLSLTSDPEKVDCQHCRGRIERMANPPQRTYSSKATWRAMKELAARHPDEYAEILAAERRTAGFDA